MNVVIIGYWQLISILGHRIWGQVAQLSAELGHIDQACYCDAITP